MIARLIIDGMVAANLAVDGVQGATLADRVVAADADKDGERLLRIADVISSQHSGDWLRRYPGCAVAVTPSHAATRAGNVRIQGADRVLVGLFAHAWLTVGYPLRALTGLTVGGQERAARGERASSFSVIFEVR